MHNSAGFLWESEEATPHCCPTEVAGRAGPRQLGRLLSVIIAQKMGWKMWMLHNLFGKTKKQKKPLAFLCRL
jgi:hypothetical protein